MKSYLKFISNIILKYALENKFLINDLINQLGVKHIFDSELINIFLTLTKVGSPVFLMFIPIFSCFSDNDAINGTDFSRSCPAKGIDDFWCRYDKIRFQRISEFETISTEFALLCHFGMIGALLTSLVQIGKGLVFFYLFFNQCGHGRTNVPLAPIFKIALKIISHRLRVIKV